MRLRTRVLLTIVPTLGALIGAMYLLTGYIVERGFRDVETELTDGIRLIEDADTRLHVQRVRDALGARVEGLLTKSADWAQWDDTYAFVEDNNADYRESNLTPDALSALQVNFLFIFPVAGDEPVFAIGLDIESGEELPIPPELTAVLRAGAPLRTFQSAEDSRGGLLLLGEQPLMIASRPIVKSDASGSPRGTFLFARYLDAAETEALSNVTHLDITTATPNAADLADEFKSAHAAMSPDEPTVLVRPSEDVISGYTLLEDLGGAPALFIRVDVPRSIHARGIATLQTIREQGRTTLSYLILALLVTGTALGIVLIALLQRSVVARVARLSVETAAIGGQDGFAGRVALQGSDELGSLAQSINRMLEALAETYQAVNRRNAEMRLIMDSVPVGLLSLDERLAINPEYSLAAERVLQARDLAGRSFGDVLGFAGDRAEDAHKLEEFLDCLQQELLSEADMAGLNPFEELPIRAGDNALWARIRYFLIRRGQDLPKHFLVVLEDITREKTLAAQAAKSHEENLQLRCIAENPDLFREFIVETRLSLRRANELCAQLDSAIGVRAMVNEIFRGVHTVKGVAGSFSLRQVAALASRLEDSLGPLREADDVSPELVEQTKNSLADLVAAFDEVVANARAFLGDDPDEASGGYLRVPLERLRKEIAFVQSMAIDGTTQGLMLQRLKAEVTVRLKALSAVPARRGLARAVKIVPGVIERVGKDIDFVFAGQDTPIDYETALELNTPLVHLLRNAIDHGIEPPEERDEKGKAPQGTVTLEVARDEQALLVTVRDDGRGLDPEKLRAAAVRKRLLAPEEAACLSDDECRALVFMPGFSTAEAVSDVSGRGVGMDAVADSIRRKLGGDIRIESTPGTGTAFILRIPDNGIAESAPLVAAIATAC